MKLKYILLLAAAALALTAGFFLPNAVAAITDSRTLGNLVTIDSQSMSFETSQELDLPGRIAFVASPNTENLPLKTGQVMDNDAARERAKSEVERFFADGLFKFAFEKQYVEECSAAFVIDTANPSVNIIVWELAISDPAGNSVYVIIDDETGVILKLIYRLGSGGAMAEGSGAASGSGRLDEEFRAIATALAEMMTSYYSLPVTQADYEFSGSMAYYRNDMFGGGDVVPMYGVVRATDFTMNEKLMY